MSSQQKPIVKSVMQQMGDKLLANAMRLNYSTSNSMFFKKKDTNTSTEIDLGVRFNTLDNENIIPPTPTPPKLSKSIRRRLFKSYC
jgi:hypothetical protein